MNKYNFLFRFAVLIIAAVVYMNNVTLAEAGTYTFGNYTFNAVHCNDYGCHDPSQKEAEQVFKYALGAQKLTYTHTLTCGNTVAITNTTCKVSTKCSKDGSQSVRTTSSCKKIRTNCGLCGCGTNGGCNLCGDSTVVNSCPDGVTVFPSDFVGPLPENAKYSSKTAADCEDRPMCTGPSCSGVGTGGDSTAGGDGTDGDVGDGEGDDATLPTCLNVTSDGKCPPPNISFSANPKLISKGGSCTLRWEVDGAEACSLDTVLGTEPVLDMTGAKSVSPEKTTVYKMTCTNGPTSASASQLCSVQDVSEQ